MPALDGFLERKFRAMLDKCEAEIDALRPYDQRLVKDLRTKLNSRGDAVELGADPWNPTVKQWNHLKGIAERL